MDFNRFQEWCQNKGFVVKLPSGYSKLINLEVSSFESFKGIFNLCMLFFYEELYKQRENESESATSVDGEAKRSKSNWCDIGKENREKEYKDSELKRLVDKVADKYDSEDSASSYDDAD